MARFLVTYRGGKPPANPEQAAAMAQAFGGWVAKSGKAIVDPGAPIHSVAQVANGTPLPAAEIGGYSIIEADTVEKAVAILKTHPFVARGGTLQLHEPLTF